VQKRLTNSLLEEKEQRITSLVGNHRCFSALGGGKGVRGGFGGTWRVQGFSICNGDSIKS